MVLRAVGDRRDSVGYRLVSILEITHGDSQTAVLNHQSYPYVTAEELLVIEKILTCYCSQFSATLSIPTHANLGLHHRPHCDFNDMS